MWYVLCITFTTLHFANGLGFYGHNFQLKDLFDHNDTKNVDEKWIKQPLDHFNRNERVFWNMRYMQNLYFWKTGGPIYLFIGAEAEVTTYYIESGLLYELAKETNGAMFASEHRFYGHSVPPNSDSAEVLKHLSSRQSLADNAELIKSLKKSAVYKNSKVVVIGGSYGGNLAAWMREQYPELIDAAVASSAPVLAKKDYYEYLQKVKEDYERYGSTYCITKIQKQFARYAELFNSVEGMQELKRTENICEDDDLTKIENKQLFFISQIIHYSSIAQYGNPTTIKMDCNNINNNNLTDSFYLHNQYKPFGYAQSQCISYDFNNQIRSMKKDRSAYSWMYQVCTEFGYFQTTSTVQNVFKINIPVEYSVKTCQQLFGMEHNEMAIDRVVANTNRFYGGLRPNVTNVVFVNGDIDPWSTLGVLKSLHSKAPAIVIPGASHCNDLGSDTMLNSPELIQARKDIKRLIKEWIM